MQYDFTSILDRRGRDAIAVEFNPIPGAAPRGPPSSWPRH